MRGTIGSIPGQNLTPVDIVEMTSAYGMMLLTDNDHVTVVVGRDGRLSGKMVQELVINTLIMLGINVIDLGLSTTPTVEMEVLHQSAHGGIIITASHNPGNWNALKFLNHLGEFISAEQGQTLLKIADKKSFTYATVENLGRRVNDSGSLDRHVEAILSAPHVNASKIKSRKFKVVVDAINSTGGMAMKRLLNALNCETKIINAQSLGKFAHNPEPLDENLSQLKKAVLKHKADLGIAVDPDVDRLAFVDEQGVYCGEEYTLVMVADWILQLTPGNTVSNLSSTRVLQEITEAYGQQFRASAVGEVNVVVAMKSTNAVIGGEGNGGVIYPGLHYGRDAMIGVALVLSALAHHNISLSQLRAKYPNYTTIKQKIDLDDGFRFDTLKEKLIKSIAPERLNTIDGVKISFADGWVHLRPSNTEPIIRLYAEAKTVERAQMLVDEIKQILYS